MANGKVDAIASSSKQPAVAIKTSPLYLRNQPSIEARHAESRIASTPVRHIPGTMLDLGDRTQDVSNTTNVANADAVTNDKHVRKRRGRWFGWAHFAT